MEYKTVMENKGTLRKMEIWKLKWSFDVLELHPKKVISQVGILCDIQKDYLKDTDTQRQCAGSVLSINTLTG